MLLGVAIIFTLIVFFVLGKHPEIKWLSIIGIVLVVFDIIVIGTLIWNITPIILKSMIDVFSSITSRIDALVLVAIITGLLTIINSIYVGHVANKNRRREYLSAKREGPYSDFIDLVYKLANSSKSGNEYTEKAIINDISHINAKLTLWASPEVVKKWNIFKKSTIGEISDMNPKEKLVLIEEVMNEMRKDLGVKSAGKWNLLAIFVNDIDNIRK